MKKVYNSVPLIFLNLIIGCSSMIPTSSYDLDKNIKSKNLESEFLNQVNYYRYENPNAELSKIECHIGKEMSLEEFKLIDKGLKQKFYKQIKKLSLQGVEINLDENFKKELIKIENN